MNPERGHHGPVLTPFPAGGAAIDTLVDIRNTNVSTNETGTAGAINTARENYIQAKRVARSFWRNNAVTRFIERRRHGPGYVTPDDQMTQARTDYEQLRTRFVQLQARIQTDALPQAPDDATYRENLAANTAQVLADEHLRLVNREVELNEHGAFRRIRGILYSNPAVRASIGLGLGFIAGSSAAVGFLPITAAALAAKAGWRAIGIEGAEQTGMDIYSRQFGVRSNRDIALMTDAQLEQSIASFAEHRILYRQNGPSQRETDLLNAFRDRMRARVRHELDTSGAEDWKKYQQTHNNAVTEHGTVLNGNEANDIDHANHVLTTYDAAGNPHGRVRAGAAFSPIVVQDICRQIAQRNEIINDTTGAYTPADKTNAQAEKDTLRRVLRPMIKRPVAGGPATNADADYVVNQYVTRERAQARLNRHDDLENNIIPNAADATRTQAERIYDVLMGPNIADNLNEAKEGSLAWERRARAIRWTTAILASGLLTALPTFVDIHNPFTLKGSTPVHHGSSVGHTGGYDGNPANGHGGHFGHDNDGTCFTGHEHGHYHSGLNDAKLDKEVIKTNNALRNALNHNQLGKAINIYNNNYNILNSPNNHTLFSLPQTGGAVPHLELYTVKPGDTISQILATHGNVNWLRTLPKFDLLNLHAMESNALMHGFTNEAAGLNAFAHGMPTNLIEDNHWIWPGMRLLLPVA